MKTIALLITLALCSCADFKLVGAIETPYGTITSDKGGATITLRPIIVREK
jgi:hypothetical protein